MGDDAEPKPGKRIPAGWTPLRENGLIERADEPGTFDLRVATGKDPLTGKYRQVQRTFRGGGKAARDKLAELRVEFAGDSAVDSDLTVGGLLDLWLAMCARRVGKPGRAGMEQNTYDNYERNVRSLKATEFAKRKAASVRTAAPVLACYNALAEVLGSARMTQVHKVLVMAYKYGIAQGWLGVNPAAMVSPKDRPEPPKRTKSTPTREDVKKFVAPARGVHADMDVFITAAALTGLRRQGLIGLRWDDIDIDAQVFTTRRFVRVVGGRAEVVEYAKARRTAGKTPKPRHLDAALVPVLKALLARQQARAARSGTTLPANGWLFSADGIGLEFLHPNRATAAMGKATEKVGVRETPHALRHHRGSQLIADGVDPAHAAEELDHRQLSYFMDTYVHDVAPEVPPELEVIGGTYGIEVAPVDEPKAPRARRRRRKDGEPAGEPLP